MRLKTASKSSREPVREVGRGQGTQNLVRNGKEFGFSSKCCEKPLNNFKWRKDR